MGLILILGGKFSEEYLTSNYKKIDNKISIIGP